MKRNLLLLLFFCVFHSFVRGQGVEYIGTPKNQNFIDSIVGAKSSPGAQYGAFEKNGSSFSVWIFSNWQESPISVCVLVEYTKDKVRIMKDILVLDFKVMRGLFPNADLATGWDGQYIEKNGIAELSNMILSVYDWSEQRDYEDSLEYFTRILKAWTIDKTRLKFIEIPTEGLTHYNEGWDA